MTPEDFFAFAKKHDAEMVDLKFVDMLGSWQHCSFPIEHLDADTFNEGLASTARRSAAGWAFTNRTCWRSPTPTPRGSIRSSRGRPSASSPTSSIRSPEGVQPRSAAHRPQGRGVPEEDAASPTRATSVPSPSSSSSTRSATSRTSTAGTTRSTRSRARGTRPGIEEPNLGYKPSFKGGYFPVSPTDTYHDLRGEMVYEMRKIGIVVEAHHHEVATAGQSEIDMQFQPLLKMADSSCGTSTSARTSRSGTARP